MSGGGDKSDLETRVEAFHPEPRAVGPEPIHQRIFLTCRRFPDRVAVIHGDLRLTYAEVEHRARCVAAFLSARGVGRESRVAVHLKRSPDWIVALLGVLAAGGAYVPLDPDFPPTRLRMMIEDGEPDLLLTHRQLDRLAGASLETVELDAAWPRIEAGGPGGGVETDLDDAIYVIFTSGSTGRPKGIVQTHRAIANLIEWQNQDSGIEVDGPVLQFASLGFDVHLQEIFSPLAAGGTVVMLDAADRLDPDRLCRVIAEHQVRTAFFPVSTLTRLLSGDDRLAGLPKSLRHLVTAGEQLYVNDNLRRFLEARPETRLHNHYGVSESHVVTAETLGASLGPLPTRPTIGRPLPNCTIAVLDDTGDPVGVGQDGEVWIAGACLARGYLANEEKKEYHFRHRGGRRWYRTGDLARWLPNGKLEFVGRLDDQLKIDGRLVEVAEVETALQAVPGVRQAVTGSRQGPADGPLRLVAWYTSDDGAEIPVDRLRRELAGRLPEFMLPNSFVHLDRVPTGPTGKVDRRGLPEPTWRRPALSEPYRSPHGDLEPLLADLFREHLGIDRLGAEDNFFDLGATSLLLAEMARGVGGLLGRRVSPLELFEHSSVRRLASHLGEGGEEPAPTPARAMRHPAGRPDSPVAIVGMAGRFPGAPSVTALWDLLVTGREGLEEVSEERLESSYFVPEDGPEKNRVRRLGLLSDPDCFDAEFFGLSPLEATWTDPQQRLFLETAWHALEDAGARPGEGERRIGVFAGSAETTYLVHVRPHLRSMADYLRGIIGNDKDFLATRVSYLLGLTGPAMTVQTACSTALVALHQARLSLLHGECDMALAGAVSVQVPQNSGYFHEEGLIYSPDGSTRPFDHQARGTNMTNGLGAVVLKRLADAEADGDRIYAVLRGTALNNDGRRKVGYSAPSVEGQAEVVAAALATAGVKASEIDLLEAHGTGTQMGDPVEVAALTRVFRQDTDDVGFCALGSVKGNIGHMNRAAGIAGLIKALLALHHRCTPPTIHFTKPNPELKLESSPFRVPTEVEPLDPKGRPARAGVSAFGIGGTNAHAVLEAYPRPDSPSSSPGPHLVTLSGRDGAALERVAADLGEAVKADDRLAPADVSLTRNLGRAPQARRVALVVQDREHLIAALAEVAATPDPGVVAAEDEPRIAFTFPGQGAQGVGIGQGLYRRYPSFRQAINEGAEAAREILGCDLRKLMFADPDDREARARLRTSRLAQTSLLLLERALSALWMSWGIRPTACIGHSTGEYAAACVTGALSLEDALYLVAFRGRLMDEVAPRGSMTVVLLPIEEARRFTGDGVFVGAMNSKGHTVLAGSTEALDRAEAQMAREEVSFRRLDNHNPNHCRLMAPMLQPYREALEQVSVRTPSIPLISNLTGSWFGAAEADDHEYWLRHLSEPVRFAQGLDLLRETGIDVLLEVGPRSGLSRLAGHHFADVNVVHAVPSLPQGDDRGDEEVLLEALGALWQHGLEPDWSAFHQSSPGLRVSLPGYPFERRHHWLPMPVDHERANGRPAAPARRSDPRRWLYQRLWQRARPPIPWRPGDLAAAGDILVVGRRNGLAGAMADQLRGSGRRVWLVGPDDPVAALDDTRDVRISHLIHVACAEEAEHGGTGSLRTAQESGLYSLAALPSALADRRCETLHVVIASRQGVAATIDGPGNVAVDPGAATLGAFRLVAPQEDPGLRCRQVDLPPEVEVEADAQRLLAELADDDGEELVAYRGELRLVPRLSPWDPPEDARDDTAFRPGAAYLITGGLGRVGRAIAEHLAFVVGCDLLLVGRRALPTGGEEGGDAGAAGLARRLEHLRSSGRDVRYVSVDLTDWTAVEDRLAPEIRAWGSHLAGALHAAADLGGDRFMCFLDQLDGDELMRQIEPKCLGLVHLNAALGNTAGELRIAFSSLATVLGGLGYTAYAASNLALEATVDAMTAQGGEGWQAVAWDLWDIPGETAEEASGRIGSSLEAYAMAPPEALDALGIFHGAAPSPMFVSTGDLEPRVERARRIADRRHREDSPDGGAEETGLPEDPLTREAHAAWREVLHVGDISLDSQFIELGGDSLTAIQVMLNLGRRLGGRRIPPTEILLAEDFGDFVARLRPYLDDGGEVVDSGQEETERSPGDAVEASLLQDRWLAMEPRRFGYLDMPVRLRGELDVNIFQAAFQLALKRHPILVGRFERRGERLFQLTGTAVSVPLIVQDLSRLDDLGRRQTLDRLAAILTGRRFDLLREPPFAALLCRLGEEDHLLYVRTHHAVFDGWSATLLLQDLDRVYTWLADGGEEPARPPQYARFAAWQNGLWESDEIEQTRDFWRRHFAGSAGPTRFPASGGTGGTGNAGAVVRRHLDSERLDRLRAAAREDGDTLFTWLTGAFVSLLAEVTGDEDVVIGTTSAGRHLPDSEAMVGVFVNPLPVRFSRPAGAPWEEVSSEVRRRLHQFHSHQRYVLADLVRHVPPFTGMDINDTFHAYILFQNYFKVEATGRWEIDMAETDDRIDDALLALFQRGDHRLMRELELVIYDRNEELSLNFWYRLNRFEATAVQDWADRYLEILEQALTDPSAPLRQTSTPTPGRAGP